MDTQNCVICQNPAVPGHDFDVNGPHFINFTKILKSSTTSCNNFDFNEFKSLTLTLNGHYKKICSTCHHQLTQFDTLTCQLHNLQLKINEISAVIKNKAVQSQLLFGKGNICSPTNTNYDDNGSFSLEDNETSFDANNDNNMPDFNFHSIEDQGVDEIEIDTKVNVKVESSLTSTAPENRPSNCFQLKLIGPHVNGANDDLDSKSKYYGIPAGLKKSEIFLEPIQLPSTNGPFNVKDIEIANFIRRDRLRIRRYKNKMKRRITRMKERESMGYKENTNRKLSERRDRPRQCPICSNPRNFYSISKYEDHIRTHTGELPFICEFCAKTFRSKSFLEKHLKRVHSNINRHQDKIKCPQLGCGVSCKSQKRLDQHILQIHHQVVLKRFLCEQCPRKFSELKVLNSHINHSHLGKHYKCPHPNCEKKLSSKDSLNLHIKCVHEKAARFFCSECNKGFYKKSKMDRHFKVHLGEKSYEFACDHDQCTRRFLIRKALEVHKLMAHSNERPFKCSTCPKAFVRPNALKDHEKLHTGIRDFICTYENCTQAYALKCMLNEHIRKHHKNPDKWLSKNIENRKGFRRRVNRVEIIKDNNDQTSNDPIVT